MLNTPASLNLPPAADRPVNVAEALSKFHVSRNIWLRRLFKSYPVIVGLVLLIDWLFFSGHLLLTDLPALTSYLSVALAAVFFVRLYDQLPETLRALWDRGTLHNTTRQPAAAEDYARFIAEFDDHLNSRWSWIAGIVVFIISRLILLNSTLLNTAGLIPVVLGSLSYFMDGVALWKLLVVAFTVTRLSHKFNVSVHPTHPDQSGGLGPLGDLCFTNALVLLGPALFFTAWVVIAGSADLLTAYPILHQQALNYADLFQRGIFHVALIALLLMELIVFLLPLYEIHREMVRQGAQHRQQLDALARQIDQINRELLGASQSLSPADAQKRLETLKWIRQVYEDNKKIPTWPFNREVILKFMTSQVVPLLSLTGLGKPILDVIGVAANLVR